MWQKPADKNTETETEITSSKRKQQPDAGDKHKRRNWQSGYSCHNLLELPEFQQFQRTRQYAIAQQQATASSGENADSEEESSKNLTT